MAEYAFDIKLFSQTSEVNPGMELTSDTFTFYDPSTRSVLSSLNGSQLSLVDPSSNMESVLSFNSLNLYDVSTTTTNNNPIIRLGEKPDDSTNIFGQNSSNIQIRNSVRLNSNFLEMKFTRAPPNEEANL